MFSAISRSTVSRSSVAYARAFHSTPAAYKTVTEKVSETAQDVNMKLGKTLAKGIEKGQNATEAVKENLPSTEQTKKKAGEAATVASQKTNEVKADARAKTDELAEKASK
ncbi:hypothetical protein DFH08DRAFT_932924 [Mycena albidolilacea]|uniref:Uncharacterized protein n=1 Tax=Mycena albidolilacea TaxID=1033008 RepID=A0AAD7AEX3_9AGAR|nr:hypothetical protein DFH08DRAFT_932924 [Mycena albidolilacea]